MAAGPTRPALRERYESRRTGVVERSAAVFARDGYERTSVAELAEQLGVATGAIYHYFAGKEQLLIAICDQLMDPLLEAAEPIARDPALGPEDRCRRLIRLWVAHVIEHRDHVRVFQQVRHVVDHGDQWQGVRRSRKLFEQLLADILDQTGEADDPRLRLRALLGMVNHTAQWFRPRGGLSPEQVADGYADLILGRQRTGTAAA